MTFVSINPIEPRMRHCVCSLTSMLTRFVVYAVAVVSGVLAGPEVSADIGELEMSSVPEYMVGDLAIDDVVVPVGLIALDPGLGLGLDASAEAGQLWVCRRDLDATARVVEMLQADFVRSQDRFAKVLIDVYGELPVKRQEVNSVRFRSLQATFQNRNKGFPVTYQMAVSWAYQLDDSHFFLPVSLGVFESFVGRAVLPDDADLPGVTDEILVIAPTEESRDDHGLIEMLSGAALIDGNSVDRISDIRKRVYRALAGESLVVAGYVAERVRPNAEIDHEMTIGLRLHKASIEALAARLVAGVLIVRKGERITEATLALLAEMKDAMAASARHQATDGVGGRLRSWLALLLTADGSVTLNGWVVGVGLLCLIALAVWTTSRLTRSRSHFPAVIPRKVEAGGRGGRRDHAHAILARALRDETVQALYSQHQEFLAHERSATELLKEFERRVSSLEPRAQEKIRHYEARIEVLETQLADKEAENRELIQRQIESTRRDIARELTGAGFEDN